MTLPIPSRYILIPDALIAAFAHDPLAVGVYVGIARLCVAAQGAAPLAARDLAAWMGSDRDADRAAMMRRIIKLEERGWVIVERARASKHRLRPTWGRDQTGLARPWDFDAAASGRPAHVRGRRVPLALFDEYLGRLDPQPGHGRALISRYFTRPLLDLTDIGVYTIGLRAEIRTTPHLRHLGLHTAAGMLLPADGRTLLERAAAGQLTTLEDTAVVSVGLSVQGYARLGIAAPTADQPSLMHHDHCCGSRQGSPSGSADGSRGQPTTTSASTHQNGQNSASEPAVPLIVWEVGIVHESTTPDPAPDHAGAAGGGAAVAEAEQQGAPSASFIQQAPLHDQLQGARDDPLRIATQLATCVVTGHQSLNPTRAIRSGEWCELLGLQTAHGVERLLIWQARAERAATERPHGITPGYYRACAAQDAMGSYRPAAPERSSKPAPHDPQQRLPALDPACDALLRAMGVRERQRLAGVSCDLIAAWQTALAHPAMAAQFTSPIGFAVAQMQRGNAPPPSAELDRWAERAQRKTDRYESWRHIAAPQIAAAAITQEQQLEARVRALALPDTDLADLCALAQALEAGATDAQALACLQT